MKKPNEIKFLNKDKTQFYSVLKERVDKYFIDNKISQHANFTMVFKTSMASSKYSCTNSLRLVAKCGA